MCECRDAMQRWHLWAYVPYMLWESILKWRFCKLNSHLDFERHYYWKSRGILLQNLHFNVNSITRMYFVTWTSIFLSNQVSVSVSKVTKCQSLDPKCKLSILTPIAFYASPKSAGIMIQDGCRSPCSLGNYTGVWGWSLKISKQDWSYEKLAHKNRLQGLRNLGWCCINCRRKNANTLPIIYVNTTAMFCRINTFSTKMYKSCYKDFIMHQMNIRWKPCTSCFMNKLLSQNIIKGKKTYYANYQ